MTSHDVRDVLNLPQDGASRPAKKLKTGVARPNLKGLAREVQNLGGDNPIAIVPEISAFKKRRLANRKPAERWELRPFSNSAREDQTLVLRHWRRKVPAPQQDTPMEGNTEAEGGVEAGTGLEDSAFAKFNAQVDVPQYSKEEYTAKLQSSDWTKEETDYLMETVRDFDLRWNLIWDRYDYQAPVTLGEPANGEAAAVAKPRTMEDLKARYYEVASKMMTVQKPLQYMTHTEYSLHETMVNYDPQKEKIRKDFVLNSLSRSKEDAREEESLLLEVKRIVARLDRMNMERRDLYQRLDYPPADQDISAFKTSAGLQTLLQNLMSADKSKKRRSLAEGVSPAGPGSATHPGMEGPRRESIAASAGGHRDSLGGGDRTPVDAPKNNKKGPPQPERRKLTEQEEQVYGVSHHDRLSSGVGFRCEKVNKLFTTKSGQQQQRLTNVLNELDIPNRLVMPTTQVAAQFEALIHAVTSLVELRKVADKLDGEIKIEETRKAERDKNKVVLGQDARAGDAVKGSEASVPATGDTAASSTAQVPHTSEAPQSAPADALSSAAGTRPATNGDEAGNDIQIKEEEQEKDKLARPGSSGAHKRSASVLSTTSDKSAKRQKK
jgi:DNA methyltransferase 1-associated protein 1